MLIGLTQQYDKMKAIRQSIITDTTKECLEKLETQRDSLKASIAQLALERRKFTKEEIVDWISRYKDGSQTLTLKEIEAAPSSDLTSMCPPYRKNPNLFPIGNGFGFLIFIKDITY